MKHISNYTIPHDTTRATLSVVSAPKKKAPREPSPSRMCVVVVVFRAAYKYILRIKTVPGSESDPNNTPRPESSRNSTINAWTSPHPSEVLCAIVLLGVCLSVYRSAAAPPNRVLLCVRICSLCVYYKFISKYLCYCAPKRLCVFVLRKIYARWWDFTEFEMGGDGAMMVMLLAQTHSLNGAQPPGWNE